MLTPPTSKEKPVPWSPAIRGCAKYHRLSFFSERLSCNNNDLPFATTLTSYGIIWNHRMAMYFHDVS